MENTGFKKIRAKLKKTQKEMAQLLGISIKAVHSYEQGWRKIPHHVERQLFFLLSRIDASAQPEKCWDILGCSEGDCPAREFKAGDMCWFINGTLCSGEPHQSWDQKMTECMSCRVFKTQVNIEEDTAE